MAEGVITMEKAAKEVTPSRKESAGPISQGTASLKPRRTSLNVEKLINLRKSSLRSLSSFWKRPRVKKTPNKKFDSLST